MERLTTINDMGAAVYKQPYQCERCGEDFWRLPDLGSGSPTDRLAAYENMQERLDRQFNGHVSIDMIIDAIIEYDKQSERDETLADAMLITNESVHKYREWKSLEEQGRMLKLPCAVGATVYCIMTGVRGINATIFSLKFDHSMTEYFGKTVFLSRSEAEAALKEIINQTEI